MCKLFPQRFEDPVTVNCSVSEMDYSLLGWEVSLVREVFIMLSNVLVIVRISSLVDLQ